MVAFAWLGGVAFVAALAYLAYFYAVVLAVPAPAGIGIARAMVIDVVLFVAFATHHSLLARARAKRWVTRIVPARAERTLYVWVASVLTIAMCALWQPLPGWYYETDGWSRALLWALQAAGLLLVVAAARAIDVWDLAGIRQVSAHANGSAIRAVGPFRDLRHPIYLGWMMLVFAAPAMNANRLLFAAVSSAYLILAIPWEEKSLVAVHGDRYRDYQRMVRWRILPGVW